MDRFSGYSSRHVEVSLGKILLPRRIIRSESVDKVLRYRNECVCDWIIEVCSKSSLYSEYKITMQVAVYHLAHSSLGYASIGILKCSHAY